MRGNVKEWSKYIRNGRRVVEVGRGGDRVCPQYLKIEFSHDYARPYKAMTSNALSSVKMSRIGPIQVFGIIIYLGYFVSHCRLAITLILRYVPPMMVFPDIIETVFRHLKIGWIFRNLL